MTKERNMRLPCTAFFCVIMPCSPKQQIAIMLECPTACANDSAAVGMWSSRAMTKPPQKIINAPAMSVKSKVSFSGKLFKRPTPAGILDDLERIWPPEESNDLESTMCCLADWERFLIMVSGDAVSITTSMPTYASAKVVSAPDDCVKKAGCITRTESPPSGSQWAERRRPENIGLALDEFGGFADLAAAPRVVDLPRGLAVDLHDRPAVVLNIHLRDLATLCRLLKARHQARGHLDAAPCQCDGQARGRDRAR
mmetsp:Transcript_47277/g.135494  ORF Transcript_47277/g.135494 Transcript_47277/m.135494 type:complete len:254 (-) Transcript_47277:1307-2068(-)